MVDQTLSTDELQLNMFGRALVLYEPFRFIVTQHAKRCSVTRFVALFSDLSGPETWSCRLHRYVRDGEMFVASILYKSTGVAPAQPSPSKSQTRAL